VRHADQLLIDPVRYLELLAGQVTAAGGQLLMGTAVVDVDDGEPMTVRCADGLGILAAEVVLATHVPSLLRTLAFALVEQRRHYAVAGVVTAYPGTTYDITDGWSTRPLTGRPEPWAVAVGGGHATGTGGPTASLHSLRAWAEQNLRMDVRYSWSTQDAFSTDRLPLVGRSPVGSRGLWFATGFGAWGLTLGTAAAHDLAGQIGGADAAWPGWSPRRFSLVTHPGLSAHVGARTLGNLARRPFSGSTGSLKPGQGEVRRVDGRHVAVSLDADGEERCVSARCTHLGCLVSWNAEAASWDCACHGSRFGADGSVLHGPATRPLEPERGTA
jgi:nitrite reductase/ring-hydroxylating ferredoxin subunit